MNTDAEITLTDTDYFKAKFKNISIRIMILFITVHKFEAAKHTTNKYVIYFMYFSKTDENNQSIFVEIFKEMHLINNFKINFFIKNNLLKAKFIDIFTLTDIALINSCEIIISITIRIKSFLQKRTVHIKASQIVSSLLKMTISIYRIVISKRDYIFESKQIASFFVYAHIVDADTTAILIRNDNTKSIKLSRNFRLKNFD